MPKRWSGGVFILQAGLFVAAVLAIFWPAWTLTYPWLAFPIALFGAWISARASEFKSMAESAKRQHVSAISQNQPGIIEIKGLKTSHFKESKTAPLDRGEIGSMGHVECPQSEPANNDLQPGRTWMVAATNCERVGDQSRNGTPVSGAGKTGHFDRRL